MTRYEYIKEKDEAALKYLVSNENGRWFLARLMEQCGVTDPLDAGNKEAMLLKEGARRVGISIRKSILNLKDAPGGLETLYQITAEHEAYEEYLRTATEKEDYE